MARRYSPRVMSFFEAKCRFRGSGWSGVAALHAPFAEIRIGNRRPRPDKMTFE